jgi:hypothetical protein
MASGKKSKEFPADYLVLNDIALWQTSFSREGEYEPARHSGKLVNQTFQSVRPEFYEVVTSDKAGSGDKEESSMMMRVLVTLGVRAVCKDDHEEEKVLHQLETTFAVDYFVIQEPDMDDLKGFVDFNCIHNAWPFWRQNVFDTFKKASLPVPSVPFFPGRSTRKKKAISSARKIGDPADSE